MRAQRGQIHAACNARLGKLIADVAHAFAHNRKLVQPKLSQLFIAQDNPCGRTAMIRRHRPACAGQGIGVGKYSLKSLWRLCHPVKRTNAVAVNAIVFVAGIGHKGLWHGIYHGPQAIGIFFHAVTQPLVSAIENREHRAISQSGSDRIPLLVRIIDAGRIVAGTVEQNSLARGGILDQVKHHVRIRASAISGMSKADHLQPDIAQNLRMVGPAWRTDVKLGHTSLLRERHGKAHSAGPARCLHAGNASAA